ncbi:MAG: GHKL domain-containing protein [Clostridia bacterium]|nr:GHKL domain-containing protein [Clostridia bacterium]
MMEIFQTIWTILTTQNETLVKLLYFPLALIETLVNMLLFTTILSIQSTRKSKIIYVLVLGSIAFICRSFIPDPYGTFLNIINIILLSKFILKTTWIKSFLAEFIAIASTSILELFMLQFYSTILKIPYESVMTIPIYRGLFTLSIYFCIFLIYKIVHYFKFHISLEKMTKKSKVLFMINALLGIVAMGIQFYLLAFYSDKMPVGITIISIVSLLGYFFISIYNILNTTKLATTSQSLEEAQLHNKTLVLLHDSMRGFKHDFHNIVQGIGGYIDTNDMKGLKRYYSQLLKDCNRVNNLTALNPAIINNPPIYSVMADKYHKADKIGIQINLGIFIDLNELEKHVKILQFTRILGILLDNAIEAASECEEKVIHVSFRKEETRHRYVMVIENTYLNKDINLDRIFEKDFSTKSKKTNNGFGLWEVRQILKKNNNLNLYTTKNDEYFIQQFEIYY